MHDDSGSNRPVDLGRQSAAWKRSKLAVSLAMLFFSIFGIVASMRGGPPVTQVFAGVLLLLGISLLLDSAHFKLASETANMVAFRILGAFMVGLSAVLFFGR